MDVWFKTAAVGVLLSGWCGVSRATDQTLVFLTLQPDPESIYSPPALPSDEEGVNEGGVHLDLTARYMTDYVYRGIERFDDEVGPEDSANLQFDVKLGFDLGKLPHPFIGVFVNGAEYDEVSNFQEIRPVVGLDWFLRPLIISAGHTAYLFPDRDAIETSEIWAAIRLDDSLLFNADEPVFSPYVFGAYDYDLYDGWYLEAGVEHVMRFEDIGLTLTAQAHVAYVHHYELYAIMPEEDSGFQHYQVGLIGEYSLNTLFNVSRRYGDWSLIGYLYYTDGIDNDLAASEQLWGGGGIRFRY